MISNAQVSDRSGHALDPEKSIVQTIDLLRGLRSSRGSLFVIGNGGSAAIASHAVTDFSNVGRLRAMVLHDSSLITCMANDYGYENALARILALQASFGDMLFAISSSGKSANICNAVERMTDIGGTVITLSGFAPDNRLRSLGDINIWLDSCDYGMVEIGHQFVLHNLSDRLLPELKQ